MNEQLKELLARHVPAPAVAVRKDDQGEITARVTYTASQAEMNTLLSAVVEECARKADQIENYVKTDNSCGDYLKKHFGIEL